MGTRSRTLAPNDITSKKKKAALVPEDILTVELCCSSSFMSMVLTERQQDCKQQGVMGNVQIGSTLRSLITATCGFSGGVFQQYCLLCICAAEPKIF